MAQAKITVALLVRLLFQHKDVEIVWYGSRSYIDKDYSDEDEEVPIDIDKLDDDQDLLNNF